MYPHKAEEARGSNAGTAASSILQPHSELLQWLASRKFILHPRLQAMRAAAQRKQLQEYNQGVSVRNKSRVRPQQLTIQVTLCLLPQQCCLMQQCPSCNKALPSDWAEGQLASQGLACWCLLFTIRFTYCKLDGCKALPDATTVSDACCVMLECAGCCCCCPNTTPALQLSSQGSLQSLLAYAHECGESASLQHLSYSMLPDDHTLMPTISKAWAFVATASQAVFAQECHF